MDAKNSKADAAKNAGTSGGSGGVSNVGKTMVAPGASGDVHISRDAFESNPKKYFDDLHAKNSKADAAKNAGTSGGSGGVSDVGKTMVAPGASGDVHISRDAFESNLKKIFTPKRRSNV